MGRARDWRIRVTLPNGNTPAATHYGSRVGALRGAIWHARNFPGATVHIERHTPAGRWVGYTTAYGEDAR